MEQQFGNDDNSSERATSGFSLANLLRQGRERLGKEGPRHGPNRVMLVVAVLVAGLVLWTALYTVPSDSVAVIQRFGKYRTDVSSGLHLKLPLGIDTATIVPVKRQLKQEFGFATPGPGPQDARRETQMVTGDLNAALVEWVVQYRISDPAKFLFEVREPSGTLRDVSESVMREVVGDRTVDEVITIGRQEIETEALTKMQDLSTKYAMGISIDQVQLKNINPPEPVQESFNEVNQAQQRINEAEGDIARFNALLAEYRKAPEVTRRRIYVETFQDVMPAIRSKIIVDGPAHSILPLLNLNHEGREADDD